MQLRKKTLIIIGLTLIGMILLIYAASQVILMQSYTDIENKEVRSALKSSLSEIEYDLSTLDSVTVDYAYWDDTFSYVQDGIPGNYIQSNFVDSTMIYQKLNVVAIVNASGQVVFARGYDLDEQQDAPVPVGIRESLFEGSPLIRSSTTGSIHGLITLPGGPMMISAYPILKSDGEGTSAGTLIMGRFLSDGEIGVLRNMSGLTIAVCPYSEAGMTPGFEPAGQLAANDSSSSIITSKDAGTISGYTLIRDIYGNPALVLRIDEHRTVYQQAQNALLYIVTSLLISGFVFSAVMIFSLEKMVISRMIRLNKSVSRIGLETDISARVPADGDDEVAQLGDTINRTLDALVASRRQLQDREQRFRNLVENIIDVVWEADSDLKLTYVSPQVRDVMGYEPDAILGRSPFELVNPGEREQIRAIIHDMIVCKGSFDLVEFVITRPDGRRADIEVGGNPIRDTAGGIVGYRGIARDIGERKRVEEALRHINDDLESRVQVRTAELRDANAALLESERKYRELVHYANSMIIRFDRDGRILYINEFACRFFGYSHDEIIGRNVLETIVPQDESSGRELTRHMKGLLKHPGEYMINVKANVRRNGERVWVSWTNKVMLDEEGRIEFILAIGNDITDLKHASDELKLINDTLEDRVQQRTAELASAVKAQQAEIAERKRVEAQIQSSLQEKEVLLKEIHHRVKNNLQIISSLLSLQSENINIENPAWTFKESQDRIRSMALIHEKLYQSKDLSHIDFAEYVRSLASYLSHSYVTGRSVTIAVDIEGMSLGIDTAIPCGLIINELVSNSLKYAFPEGRQGEIRVGLVRTDDRYLLTVSDDGIGLPPGFDFRNTPSLGLQLVNTLVGQLEGTIDLDSSCGTRFRITFTEQKPGTSRPVAP